MSQYDEIRRLIEANPDVAEFASFGDGTSEEWISRAEEALECPLPETYKWWVRNFSGGAIGGEEIFSIYGEDFDTVVGGDIVCMYRLERQNSQRIPLCHSDVDGVFTFDSSLASSDGEYPIISEATGKVYASDFLDFLKKRIALFQSA
ncbi:MAG: SMI1/KNR4 family protein [Planctomycetaceae bacterium]